ncbi:nucleotide sugar dehydrogenase [Candidatus Woesearchaeota archaeon]|nr:nucleotide sugar dehydrogenase [Candidatus Woesearchaeota archaeon]
MSILSEQLKHGKKIIGVWGLGFIGFSSMAYFAKAGIHCLGTDIYEQRVRDINQGKPEIPNLEYWIAFDTKQLAKAGLMKATPDWKKLIDKDVAVHLITIPTEKDGKPYFEILKDVVAKLCSFKGIKTDSPPLVIIESTMTPTAVDKTVIPLFEKNGLKVGKDILLGVAPRRDWFVSPDKTLATLPRVVGGTTPETTQIMKEVLGIICNTVLEAHDHKHAAIVKSIENAYRQVEITLANQLSLAYPDLDMVQILKLAGTKWNVGTYHPSFGTGGYCVPLAPQYVLEGAAHPEALTILKASLETDFSQPRRVVEMIKKRGFKKVGILGLAYVGDLKVQTLSPTIGIAKELKKEKISVKVHDPLFTPEEIKQHTGAEPFDFPEGLNEFDIVLMVANHSQYKYTSHQDIKSNLKNCKVMLDNMGFWKEIEFGNGMEYYEAGGPNWLEHKEKDKEKVSRRK